jgi:hypothetical protein
MRRVTSKIDKLTYDSFNKEDKDIIMEIKEKEEKYISSPPRASAEKENGIIVYTEPDITPPDKIRSEVNFLVYPVFKLEKKKDDGVIEVKVNIERDNQKLELFWGVYPHPYFGIPGPFDKKVFDAIQEIIEELPRPIQNPIPIGSLYSLCKRIGIDEKAGKNYNMIKDSLLRLTGIMIDSKGTFYEKGKKRWVEDVFHLYDRVVWVGEELPDGTIADTNYIYLGSKYLENINNGYVKPIDYKFYRELNSSISKRLYELLGVKFYPIFQRNIEIKFIRYLYDTLCELVPMKKQRYFSYIKRQLEDAIAELQEKGFLEKCEIKKENGKFYVYFYPGPKAKEEFSRFRLEIEPYEDPQPFEENKQLASSVEAESGPKRLLRYFYKRNSGRDVIDFKPKEIDQAERLLYKYDFEKASFIVDYAIESARKTNFDMKSFGAVLQYEAEAVEKYEAMKRLKQREEEDRKRKEEEERLKEEARLKAEEEARRIDEIISSLSDEEFKEIRKEAEVRAKERGKVFIDSGKPIPELLISLCIREIIRERYL